MIKSVQKNPKGSDKTYRRVHGARRVRNKRLKLSILKAIFLIEG